MGGTYWYYVSILVIVVDITDVRSTKLMATKSAIIAHSHRQLFALCCLGKV
jgi:hypothetical protein